MAEKKHDLEDSTPLRIRRGRVESVDLYEIKDTELDALEKGTPAELQLNFAVFLWSIAFGAISSLATATFANATVHTIYIVVSVVSVLLGAYLLIAWWRTRSAVKELCKRIRERIPPDVGMALDDPQGDGIAEEEDDGDATPPPKG